jgi:hypothetical protein
MKTEDELDAEIAQMFDEAKVTKVEMVNGKPRVTEEPTVAEADAKEMEEAIADLVRSYREFMVFTERGVDPTDPLRSKGWWRALGYLALGESRAKDCFCGRDRSPVSVQQYAKFRSKMLEGKRYRPDA